MIFVIIIIILSLYLSRYFSTDDSVLSSDSFYLPKFMHLFFHHNPVFCLCFCDVSKGIKKPKRAPKGVTLSIKLDIITCLYHDK